MLSDQGGPMSHRSKKEKNIECISIFPLESNFSHLLDTNCNSKHLNSNICFITIGSEKNTYNCLRPLGDYDQTVFCCCCCLSEAPKLAFSIDSIRCIPGFSLKKKNDIINLNSYQRFFFWILSFKCNCREIVGS